MSPSKCISNPCECDKSLFFELYSPFGGQNSRWTACCEFYRNDDGYEIPLEPGDVYPNGLVDWWTKYLESQNNSLF